MCRREAERRGGPRPRPRPRAGSSRPLRGPGARPWPSSPPHSPRAGVPLARAAAPRPVFAGVVWGTAGAQGGRAAGGIGAPGSPGRQSCRGHEGLRAAWVSTAVVEHGNVTAAVSPFVAGGSLPPRAVSPDRRVAVWCGLRFLAFSFGFSRIARIRCTWAASSSSHTELTAGLGQQEMGLP